MWRRRPICRRCCRRWRTAYEHATGIKLVVSYGSSATLATQIMNGDSDGSFSGGGLQLSGEDSRGGAGGCEGADAVCARDAGAVGAEGLAAAADDASNTLTTRG